MDAEAVARALGGQVTGPNRIAAPGPAHSPKDRSLSLLLDPNLPEGFRVHSFACDDWRACRDHVLAALRMSGSGSAETRMRLRQACDPIRPNRPADNTAKARFLWARSMNPNGTVAETYLRRARGYGGPIPPSLRFLPARGAHGPAMIAAFGMAPEVEPGIISISERDIRGVHLTKLLADGSGKAETTPNKIMIGRGSCGYSIVIAPLNDLLGLAITEGIEDGFSVHAATGLGVWAAGSANRMPALAGRVPWYVESVSICGHDDDAGQRGARALAEGLSARGIEARILLLPAERGGGSPP
jgi:hypothetical protein